MILNFSSHLCASTSGCGVDFLFLLVIIARSHHFLFFYHCTARSSSAHHRHSELRQIHHHSALLQTYFPFCRIDSPKMAFVRVHVKTQKKNIFKKNPLPNEL